MAIVQWVGANWVALASAVGAILGVVSMILHIFKDDAAAASVDQAKKVLDQLDGQAPKV